MRLDYICSSCNGFASLTCDGCQKNFCRWPCWRFHNCGVLTDRNGRLLGPGTTVRFPNTEKYYVLLETEKTYRQVGVMLGRGIGRRKVEDRKVIHVRLVEVIGKEDSDGYG